MDVLLRTASCDASSSGAQLLFFVSTLLLLSGPGLESHDPADLAALTLFLLAAATCLPLQVVSGPHDCISSSILMASLFASRLGPQSVDCQVNSRCWWRDGGLRRHTAEHARSTRMCVCVPVPFWHLGQPIEAPNFLTIASVMYILRPLAVMGVFAVSAQSSSGCGGSAAGRSASAAAVPAAFRCVVSKHCNAAEGIRR